MTTEELIKLVEEREKMGHKIEVRHENYNGVKYRLWTGYIGWGLMHTYCGGAYYSCTGHIWDSTSMEMLSGTGEWCKINL